MFGFSGLVTNLKFQLLEERNTHDRLVKEDREKLTKLAEFSSKYVDLKRQLGDLKKDYAYLLQHKKKETTEDQPIQKKLNPNPAVCDVSKQNFTSCLGA